MPRSLPDLPTPVGVNIGGAGSYIYEKPVSEGAPVTGPVEAPAARPEERKASGPPRGPSRGGVLRSGGGVGGWGQGLQVGLGFLGCPDGCPDNCPDTTCLQPPV